MAIRFKRSVLSLGLLLLLLLAGGLLNPISASSNLQSRVVRLEFELRSLRSQVNQLQAQTSGNAAVPSRTAPPLDPPPASTGFDQPSLDEQFDNLATLVIELRDQVRALETEVSELSSRLP